MLLSACGGSSDDSSSSGTGSSSSSAIDVSTSAGTGGNISPSSAKVNPGDTATFTVTPKTGYVVAAVMGCGGQLSGSSYTTGTISANCTVTASFSAAFTWVGGSSSVNVQGIYGTQGVAAPANMPGGRDNPVSWTDSSGNLWLFGGSGIDSAGAPGYLNDLWQFSPTSGQWTWVSGSSMVNAAGSYGMQGQATATNAPGARLYAVSWTDSSGNLWLFGGHGYDSAGTLGNLNDLWQFSPARGQWAWVAGSNGVNEQGTYGTQGQAATTNVPGARDYAISWTDSSGNLWLFGGNGYDSGGILDSLNDLWRFSPANNQWTWVSGSSAVNAKGSYGTQGTADATNVPGARIEAVSWADNDGNLWLFGGFGYDSAGTVDFLNDLWQFSPGSTQWTWVGGSSAVDAPGIYGTQGEAAATNVPGGRVNAVSWTDSSGNLWLFGGNGVPGNVTYLNDLWQFSPASGQWTWIGGSSAANAQGSYGTQGTAVASNVPGARVGAASWTDSSGNLWLFGGDGLNLLGAEVALNDLWRYPTQ